jgi:hypothetical protein
MLLARRQAESRAAHFVVLALEEGTCLRAILAVPMLAIVKIVSNRVRLFKAFGHFLEDE